MESVTEADTEVVKTTEDSTTCRVIGIHHTQNINHRTPINRKVQRNTELPFETNLATDIQAEGHIRCIIIIIVINQTVINRTFSAKMTVSRTIAKTNTSGGTHEPVPYTLDIEYPINRDIGIYGSETCPKISCTSSQIQIHSVIERMLIGKLLIIPAQTTANGARLSECDACYGKHDNHCCK